MVFELGQKKIARRQITNEREMFAGRVISDTFSLFHLKTSSAGQNFDVTSESLGVARRKYGREW